MAAAMDIRWPEWTIEIDEVLRRVELHEKYSGQRQGGISSAPQVNSVFLFSSQAGRQFGYNYDGWKSDGSYHYTGEGQLDDQQMIRGNKLIAEGKRTLRLFEGVGRTTVRYCGSFRLDEKQPWYRKDAPDLKKQLRSVIVFRLWPIDAVRPAEIVDEGSQENLTIESKPTSRFIPLEAHNTKEFEAQPATDPAIRERREAALVTQYGAWLTKKDHVVGRNEIKLPGQAGALLSDLFDETTAELVEAKGAASRDNVRLALGQVLDYSRYVDHRSLAVLLPVRPAEDLVELLIQHAVGCVYPVAGAGFERVDGMPSTHTDGLTQQSA